MWIGCLTELIQHKNCGIILIGCRVVLSFGILRVVSTPIVDEEEAENHEEDESAGYEGADNSTG